MDYGHTKAKSLIQIPNPNKYLGCGYKGLVFCRNNGWLMENSTKIGADKSDENIQKFICQNCLPKPKSLGFR